MTRFQRATLDPFDRCWMFPWRGSVHGPPTCLCRPLFKMAEVARVQGREVLSAILSSSSFFFQILRFGFWILDFRGDENIRREIDNVERCVWRWNNWTRRIFGKILSGVWWKFGFSFFLILKFRENSKSHRVVEMLEDIWDGEWKGNDRVFFCRRMGENDDGGCGDQWWIRFFKKDTHFSLEYLHLPNDLINVTEIGFFMIGGGTTWQRKKKMKKTKAHEVEEIFSSLLLLFYT